MFGYFMPATIAAAATIGVCAYGLSFRRLINLCVSRVDYSHNTGEVRIFTNANNSEGNYIQTYVKNLKPYSSATAENENK